LILSSRYRAYPCGKSFATGSVHKISNVSEDFCFCCNFAETEDKDVMKFAANATNMRTKQQQWSLPGSPASIHSK
jgi:hypothetical protein